MPVLTWDLFEGIPNEDVTGLVSLGSSKVVRKGSVIFGLGDEADDLYLVASGKVNLTLPLRLGETHLSAPVEERLPGQLLGWSALIPPHRFTLQAMAVEPTELLVLPRKGLEDVFSSRPDLGYAVLANLAKVIGQRLQVFQTMWIREMQRALESRSV